MTEYIQNLGRLGVCVFGRRRRRLPFLVATSSRRTRQIVVQIGNFSKIYRKAARAFGNTERLAEERSLLELWVNGKQFSLVTSESHAGAETPSGPLPS